MFNIFKKKKPVENVYLVERRGDRVRRFQAEGFYVSSGVLYLYRGKTDIGSVRDWEYIYKVAEVTESNP